ncbi:hypothetical protein LQG66_29420 [Bradyrhizobium ontarionense]|uniref:YitT family protein n=1 Tax=Bradyrhizobium ontarionense TaxID=2898149 RepID=A0ABY3R8N7_9BRAD|nr:hypothetical protein [Bradyrhizobium sp. A19]UFZ03314.1 hypothetical protein LQG66_29420 [Bradyrhizobium sp. A19]
MTLRLFIYLAGCITFSVGAYCYIYSHLGTDPLDVLALGLRTHLPVTVGMVQTAVAVVCLAGTAVLTSRRPLLSPLLTFFLCGNLIDLLLHVELGPFLAINPLSFMVLGTMLCAYGSALIIMSGFGIRAIDLLAIAIVKRWSAPFWLAKGSLEALLLGSGYLLGGPVGIGTLSFMVLVNGLIQPMMWGNGRLFNLPNFGLPPEQVTSST